MYCKRCGTEQKDGQKFCPKCDTPFSVDEGNNSTYIAITKMLCMLRCLFCNMTFYAIFVFFVVITICAYYCCLEMLNLGNIGSVAEFITAVVAVFAFIATIIEYSSLKDARQAKVLSEYNKRFSEDPNVVKVVKYLNYIDEYGTINNPFREKPSNYEVEMFMRFFEELELQIRNNRLNEEDICNLFVYYAHMLSGNEELRLFLGVNKNDYERCWDGFKRIAQSYEKYHP